MNYSDKIHSYFDFPTMKTFSDLQSILTWVSDYFILNSDEIPWFVFISIDFPIVKKLVDLQSILTWVSDYFISKKLFLFGEKLFLLFNL